MEEGNLCFSCTEYWPCALSFIHSFLLLEHLSFSLDCVKWNTQTNWGIRASLNPPGSLGTRRARHPAGDWIPIVSKVGSKGEWMAAQGCPKGQVKKWAKRSVSYWTEDPSSAQNCTSKQKEFGWSDNGHGVERYGRLSSGIKDARKAAQTSFPCLQHLIFRPSSELLWVPPPDLPGSCSFLFHTALGSSSVMAMGTAPVLYLFKCLSVQKH